MVDSLSAVAVIDGEHIRMNFTGMTEKLFTSLSIFVLLLLAAALIIAWNNPAKGYEPSIYLSTPVVYWIALAFCYCLSGCLLCFHVRQYKLSPRLKIAGCILAMLATVSFISLFIIRGHLIYCIYGDTGVHIGNLLNAISSGHTSVIYPGSYVETLALYLTTNIDLYPLLNYHVLIYGCVFVLGVYLAAREISGNKRIALLTAFIACLFPFGSAYYSTGGWTFSMYIPYLMTFLLFPVLIYLISAIVNRPKLYQKLFISSTIMCIVLSTYHLFASMVAILFIICLIVVASILKWIGRKQVIVQVGGVLLTSSVFYIMWVSTTFYFQSQISSFFMLLFENKGVSYNKDVISEMGSSVFSSYQLLDVIDFIFRSYGLLILLCLLALIAIPLIFKAVKSVQKAGAYSVFYPFCAVCGVMIIYSFVGTSAYQTGRVVPFVVLGCIFITGYLFYRLMIKDDTPLSSFVFPSIAVVLLICICVSGVGSYYQAPHTLTSSIQETNAGLHDMNFYVSNIYHYYNSSGLAYYPYVYAFALLGTKFIKSNSSGIELIYGVENYPNPPDHFGYHTINNLGEYYAYPTYLVITQRVIDNSGSRYDRLTISKFDLIDYFHLEYDISVNKVHDNYVDIYTIF